jgi:hypothetical protein
MDDNEIYFDHDVYNDRYEGDDEVIDIDDTIITPPTTIDDTIITPPTTTVLPTNLTLQSPTAIDDATKRQKLCKATIAKIIHLILLNFTLIGLHRIPHFICMRPNAISIRIRHCDA